MSAKQLEVCDYHPSFIQHVIAQPSRHGCALNVLGHLTECLYHKIKPGRFQSLKLSMRNPGRASQVIVGYSGAPFGGNGFGEANGAVGTDAYIGCARDNVNIWDLSSDISAFKSTTSCSNFLILL